MNIRKHADAKNVWVRLSLSKNQLEVEVRDDGEGFELKKVDESTASHFGIRIMRERAKLLRGKLFVNSKPGKGTTVKAVFPLK